MVKVGVIGVGFVGDAIAASLLSRGVEVHVYDQDPEKVLADPVDLAISHTSLASMIDVGLDLTFVCVPTQFSDELDTYDMQHVENVCHMLSALKYKGVTIIKSTVSPGTCSRLAAEHPRLQLVHSPEFLTARTARRDVDCQTHIVVGADASEPMKVVCDFMAKQFPSAHISTSSMAATETMKIAANSFYAVKVQFYNELFLLCQRLKIEFPVVRDMMLRNQWIHPMHTQVPGPDGCMSFGGACLPKDIRAFAGMFHQMALPSGVLDAAIKEQESMRP